MTEKIGENSELLIIDLKTPEKRYIVPVNRGAFFTKRGEIDLKSLIGKSFGREVKSHLGAKFAILKPTFYDRIMKGIKRQTQIVYPKDAGYIALLMGLTNGQRVFECGAGSGAMTSVIANAVAPDGLVVSFERDERFLQLARENIETLGFSENIELHLHDLADGIENGPFDAAFIDIREPWLHTQTIWNAVIGGAPMVFILPTTNQICELLGVLENHGGFIDTQVMETMLRFYKPVSQRLRPADRMVAHTTYVVFARKLTVE